jgi:putative PIN family toxin of toxin-antitoxin system
MAIELRSVFDTSVVVSAVLLPRSVPRQAFDRALERGKLLVSAATVDELNEVLHRPRFNKYVLEEERMEFLAALLREAELVEVIEVVTQCRDPKDNKFLELAASGSATCVVTGDQDLLALNPFRGIPLWTPQEFLAQPA